MQRIFVPLTADEAKALLTMSQADCRHPREQMRYLLREAARARGLLPPQASADSSSLQRTQPVTMPNTAESADSAEEAGVSRLDEIAYLLRIARAAQIFVCIPNSDHDEELRDNAEDDLREALL